MQNRHRVVFNNVFQFPETYIRRELLLFYECILAIYKTIDMKIQLSISRRYTPPSTYLPTYLSPQPVHHQCGIIMCVLELIAYRYQPIINNTVKHMYSSLDTRKKARKKTKEQRSKKSTHQKKRVATMYTFGINLQRCTGRDIQRISTTILNISFWILFVISKFLFFIFVFFVAFFLALLFLISEVQVPNF